MAVDVETQAEVLNALADFWQNAQVVYAEVLTEEDERESQRWIDAVRNAAGMIVSGIDVLSLNE